MLWRPWTQLFPMTVVFSVIDHDRIVTKQVENQQLVEFVLYRFEREYIEQVYAQPYLMNCATAELVPLNSENRPHIEALQTMTRTSPLYRAVCAG